MVYIFTIKQFPQGMQDLPIRLRHPVPVQGHGERADADVAPHALRQSGAKRASVPAYVQVAGREHGFDLPAEGVDIVIGFHEMFSEFVLGD